MGWLRLDDKFANHPKVVGLSDRAFRVHINAMVYCAQYGTRGKVPEAAKKLLGITPKIEEETVAAGLWEREQNELKVHNYERYNPSDATGAERAARHRRNANVTDGVTATHAGARARPFPSHKEKEEERERSNDYVPQANRNAGTLTPGEQAERYVRMVAWQYEPDVLTEDLQERGLNNNEITRLAAIAAELREAARASQQLEPSADGGADSGGEAAIDGA